ncbi:CcdB family protein [Sphaerotilus microaerophilus]|uniref:Toxin CcdB n=1 Tax=Sphaerotilus microaerophilus TaxID=2914710 RepID=A0ABM7YT88_9BURK|nr:CcdB family protein [Sphaerotilus sp. FB-5]BDI07877.1 plasmid maintenance protein CcdB [Sphaerotilus sp. FB-5]
MARFDVYAGVDGGGYLLDVQANLLSRLNTRVVVPLLPLDQAPTPADRLNPRFQVNGVPVVMATQFMAAVPAAELRQQLAALDHESNAILDAIDFLHQGW